MKVKVTGMNGATVQQSAYAPKPQVVLQLTAEKSDYFTVTRSQVLTRVAGRKGSINAPRRKAQVVCSFTLLPT
eukprot:6176105-Pleurochrysis_carterae.AAC.2